MTRIDLIPPELVEQQRARRIIILMAVAFSIILFAVAFLSGLLVIQRSMISGRLGDINSEKGKVESEIGKLKVYEERKKELESREKLIATITKDQVFWSPILNGISMVIPHDIWLKELKGDISPILKAKGTAQEKTVLAQPAVTMTGYAFNHSAVARWLVHLGEINQFRHVWLVSSEQKEVEKRKLIEFQTTTTLTQFETEEQAKK